MITPPIVARDTDGCVLIFDSVSQAEGAVEPLDVEDGEYVVFDSRGTPLVFEFVHPEAASGSKSVRLLDGVEMIVGGGSERLDIRLAEAAESEAGPEDLRHLLEEALDRIGGGERHAGLDLDELVRRARERRRELARGP